VPEVETKIWLALKARATAMAAALGLPVAWPNESFAKPATDWLRVTHIPNTNTRRFLRGSDAHRRLSLLQIDYMGQLDYKLAVSREKGGLVASYFPADYVMIFDGVKSRVAKAPDVAQSIPEDTHVMVPVTIQIETFA
jgi:hypothetical protein